MAVKTVLGPGVTPDGIFAFGDPILMQTVLINLIRNALEAMPGPGETILTVSLESQLRLDITNPGEVPVNIRDKFFEKYATAGKKKGTGLGTYSARLIALQFGGDVELNCSQPGQTTVTVRLIKADPPL